MTALGHQWLWHRRGSDVYISVTTMATDTAVTAVDNQQCCVRGGSWHCCDSGDNRQCCVSGGSWHRCDSVVYISVTAMTADSAVTAVKTDSAVTAVAADSAVTAMCKLVWQRSQLPLLLHWCTHRCHTNVHIAVTLIWTSLSQRCQCHRFHSAVSCHRCHTSVHSSVTALLLSPLLHHCQFTSMTH